MRGEVDALRWVGIGVQSTYFGVIRGRERKRGDVTILQTREGGMLYVMEFRRYIFFLCSIFFFLHSDRECLRGCAVEAKLGVL